MVFSAALLAVTRLLLPVIVSVAKPAAGRAVERFSGVTHAVLSSFLFLGFAFHRFKLSAPASSLFLKLLWVLRVEPEVQVYVEAVSHVRLVHLVDLHLELLGNTVSEVLSKLEEVVFFELLDFVSSLDFVTETRAFNGVGEVQVEVSMNTQSRTVLLVFFVSELAVLKLEEGRHVVQYHREPPDKSGSLGLFDGWAVAEDGVGGRVCVNVQEHLELVVLVGLSWNLLLEVAPEELHLRQPHLQALRVVVGEEMAVHVSALCIAAVVTCDNSVWIDDRHHPELVLVAQLVGQKVLRD